MPHQGTARRPRQHPDAVSSADYAMLIVAETEKWCAMIKAANIKLE